MFDLFKDILSVWIGDASFYDAFAIFSLVLARMVALIHMVPFLGSKNAPPQVKMGLAVLFSLLFFPYVFTNVTAAPTHFLAYGGLLIKEIFVGFAIGFVTSQIFYAVEMMGQIIDVVRATNQAQLLVPELQERSSAFGDFNYQFLLAIFLTLGLHVSFFKILTESFVRVPILHPGTSPNPLPAIHFFSSLLSEIFLIAASLAFPIALVCFLSDLAFGLLNRVAPQINAYFMSMPAKAAGGAIVFLAAFSVIAEQFVIHSKSFLEKILHLFEVIR